MRLGRLNRNTTGQAEPPPSRESFEPDTDAEARALREAVAGPVFRVDLGQVDSRFGAMYFDDQGNAVPASTITGDPDTGIVRIAPPAGETQSVRIANRVPRRLHNALAARVQAGEMTQEEVFTFLDTLSALTQVPACGLPLFYQENDADPDPAPGHTTPEEAERFEQALDLMRLRDELERLQSVSLNAENNASASLEEARRIMTTLPGQRLEPVAAGDPIDRLLQASAVPPDRAARPRMLGPFSHNPELNAELSRIMGLPVVYTRPAYAPAAPGTITTREGSDNDEDGES